MTRIAHERVDDLFGLAESEATHRNSSLADRYLRLARKVGARYNVRLAPEYRQIYCRSCTTFWVEGRTVRTRLRSGRRVQTCLRCGQVRRVPIRSGTTSGLEPEGSDPTRGPLVEAATVEEDGADFLVGDDEEGEGP